jgi:hypothetical protein
MNDREILAACLRWHTAHIRRLEIGAELRRYRLEQKQHNGLGGSDYAISQRLTAAKRPELAALRALAAICAKVRGCHIDDADVVDVPVLIASDQYDTDTGEYFQLPPPPTRFKKQAADGRVGVD